MVKSAFLLHSPSYRFLSRLFYILLASVIVIVPCFSQSIPVGGSTDETARSLQLLGKIDSSVSFTVRPLIQNNRISFSKINTLIGGKENNGFSDPTVFAGGKCEFQILPVTLIQQFNSHHPYGWNDGAMIAAKGYQSYISAGFSASFGPVDIQCKPEWVFAPNPSYENNSIYGNPVSKSYNKFFPGQSSIKLSFGSVSLGLSSENLWWGPGRNSSLLMSNNAPGFIHGFLSSKKPLHTGIGSFEWQLIGGKLTSNNAYVYENNNLRNSTLPLDSRYLSAYVISYQPKWVPGLFLGMTRALQRYKKDIQLSAGSFLNQYIPVLSKPFQKQNALGDDTLKTDQLASFFVRWVLPKVHAEFYFEYGFNDYNYNVRDYLMTPTHSAAYIAGFKKIVPLTDDKYIDFGFEITQMSQTPDMLVRDAGNWYVHSQIAQGYTHNNQILGAGAGLGCNVQSINTSWVNGWKKFGVLLERVERDPVNHADKWTDLSIGLMPQWKYKTIVLSGILQFINSSNYAWEKDQNRLNVHCKIGLQYFL